jgi:hypothetical protein
MPDLLEVVRFACDRRSMRTNQDRSLWIVGAATVAVGIGSVMPWMSTQWANGRVEVVGTNGDGRVTILAATAAVIAIAVATKIRSKRQLVPALGLLAGAVVAATAVYDSVTIRNGIGAGLWIVDAAAVVLLAGALLALHEATVRRTTCDFEALMTGPIGDLVVSRTVVITMPTQRKPTDARQARSAS